LSKPPDPHIPNFRASEEVNLDSEALVQLLSRQELSFCLCDPTLPDCPIVFVSNGFESLTGYLSAEIIGRNCRFLQGPDTGLAATRTLRTAVKTSRVASEFILNYKKDGTPFLNSVSIISLKDVTGKTVRLHLSFHILKFPFSRFKSRCSMPLSRHFSQHASKVSIVGIQSEITDRTIPETMTDPQAIAQMKLAFKIVDEAVGAAESVEMIDGRATQVAGRGLKRTAGSMSKGSKKSPAQRAPKRTGSLKAHANATHELKNFIPEDQQQHLLNCFADDHLQQQQ
jgi:hypothetical protein